MSNWEQMETQAFISGKRLPKEIQETNDNHAFIEDTSNLLFKVEEVITNLKQKITRRSGRYDTAKRELDIESLKKFNSEIPALKKLIDKVFDTTLNGLTAKEESESEDQMNERLQEEFKIPLKK